MPRERSGRRGEWNEVVKAVVRRHRAGLYKDESELSITDHSLALTMKKLLLLYDEIDAMLYYNYLFRKKR